MKFRNLFESVDDRLVKIDGVKSISLNESKKEKNSVCDETLKKGNTEVKEQICKKRKNSKSSDNKSAINETINSATIEEIDSFLKLVKEQFPGSEAYYDGDSQVITINLSK